jgi:hypothetical protein
MYRESVFRNLPGAAEGALIRAAASTQPFVIFMDAQPERRSKNEEHITRYFISATI